jgi:hypothetical protein
MDYLDLVVCNFCSGEANSVMSRAASAEYEEIGAMNRRHMISAITLALTSALLYPGTIRAAERPILAELFTSQGCSSCPPADAVLGDLAKRPDVLALSFHVDYWDNLGWKDPFSLSLATARQHHYAQILGSSSYTPQLVVDGRAEAVGSDRRSVEALLVAQRRAAAQAVIQERNGRFDIHIDGAVGQKNAIAAQILLVTFDAAHRTPVRAGENGGRSLQTYNDVRSLRSVGVWRGEPVALEAAREGTELGERTAVIIQSEDGVVWALATTPAHAY